MKNHSTPTSLLILLTFLLEFTCLHSLLSQNHLYGTTTDQYFTRVIPDAQGFYVLGQENGIATITHIDPNGNWDWTHMLNTASLLTDGIVQPNNDLLFIGMTLPFNSTNKSIIGEISSGGVSGCLNIIDQPGLEGLSRIDFNGTNYSAVGIQTQAGSLQDVILLELNSPCNIVNKKYFLSAAVDDFANDIAIIGNDLYVAGKVSNRAIIYHHSLSNNAFIDGVQMPANYTYADLHEYGTDLLAIANPVGSGQPHLMRFDANLFLQWEVDLFGVSSLQQIVEQGGDIYVIGTATISGLPRSVIIKIDDSTGPQLVWAKYLDDNETGYISGAIALLPTGNIVYVDGRAHPSGYGLQDAFLAITDGDLTTVCTESITLDMSNELTLFESPVGLVLEFYDTPPLMADIAPEITWESRGMCGTADPIDTCICPTPEMVLTQNGNDYFLACLPHGSPTPVLSCPVGPVTISGFYGCVDQNTGEPCEEESNVTWTLNGPGGTIDGGSTTNYPSFLFPSSYFQTNGTYTLTLTTVCPNSADTCVCILDWIVECDSCCLDYDLFCQYVMNSAILNVDPQLCKATLDLSGLPDCDSIINIDWGELPVDQGPFGNGDMPMHVYSASGTYFISFLALEFDPVTGLPCFEKVIYDTITIDCDSTSIFKCGQAIVSFAKRTTSNGYVLGLYDVRDYANQATLNGVWNVAPYVHPDWTYSRMGEVFGIAIDKNYDVFVTASKAYWSSTNAGFVGNAGTGGIYKISHTTGNVSDFVTTNSNPDAGCTIGSNQIPNASINGPGLGNICYDKTNDQFFVTNWEDGLIYRISSSGIILSCYDPWPPTSVGGGVEPIMEIPWGIGVLTKNGTTSVYFSQWNSDQSNYVSSPSAPPPAANLIYSIDLSSSGDFIGTHTVVATIPILTSWFGRYTNPISDIEFSEDGSKMLLGQRSMYHYDQPSYYLWPNGNHSAVFEYTYNTSGSWSTIPKQYYIGNFIHNTNAAGGVDYGYRYFSNGNVYGCDSIVWSTGDNLWPCSGNPTCPSCSPPSTVFGLAGIPINYSNGPAVGCNFSLLNNYYVDIDNNIDDDQRAIGDIDIFKCCNEMTSDTCYCKSPGFTDLILQWDNGPGVPIECQTSYEGIPCPQTGNGYFITGKFECDGDNCQLNPFVSWELSGPTGVHSGPAPQATPYFAINLLPSYTSQNGIYTMTLTSFCGMDTCKCEFQFAVNCDSCECGGLAWAEVWGNGPAPQLIACQDTMIVDCNTIGASFIVHGDLLCQPDSCHDNKLYWLLDRPGTLSDLQGTYTGYPHFDVILSPPDIQYSGYYTLTIWRNCGTKKCPCVFTFYVTPCPCDCPIDLSHGQGFDVSGNKSSCKRKLKPKKLCPIDVVTYTVNGPGLVNAPYGPTFGNNSISINFPYPGGTYNVCMKIMRTTLAGGICDTTICRTVIVKCASFPPDQDPHITTCPGGDRLLNGDFMEGLNGGFLEEFGTISNWHLFPNEGDGIIQIADSTGASDDGQVIFIGRKDHYAGIYQDVNIKGSTGYLGFNLVNYLGEALPAGTKLVFKLLPNSTELDLGQVLFEYPINSTKSDWQEYAFSFPLQIDKENHFFVISLQNESDTLMSIIGLDNLEFCTDESVGIQPTTSSSKIKIYPNPNSGEFTLELPSYAALSISYRISNLTGQTILDNQITPGNSRIQVKTHDLAPGLYFIQLLENGKIIATEKLVKQ